MKLREEAFRLYSKGYGPRSIATALKLKHGIQIGEGAVAGWIYPHYQPQELLKTGLTPSQELAIIAAASVSDGTPTEKQRARFAIQMRDPEPIELVVECLKKVTGRNDYQIRYLPSRKVYYTCTYRKDLYNYLRSKSNILELLNKYPKEFIKMFFEAEGAPSATITRRINSKRKYSDVTGYFNAMIVAVNSDLILLEIIQEELKRLSIQANIRLGTKAGTIRIIQGEKAVFQKNCYRLEITCKDSIIYYRRRIGFISKRKQEKLMDITDILERCGKTEKGAIEWIRRYEHCKKSKEKWVKRNSPLTYKEALSALINHIKKKRR